MRERDLSKLVDAVLTDRQSTILYHIVETYVKTAKPVGSRNLAKKYSLGISAATIRNVMNDLEEMGLLCQPHVSAGRIPTDKGYRFYVNGLMSLQVLGNMERRMILENLHLHSSVDVNEILQAASRVLGRISSQLGVVLEPRFYQGVFQKMELVSVSENRVLAVLSIKSGLVKTIMMEIESGVSDDQLHETAWLINERLSGLSLLEVKETIDQRLNDVTVPQNRLLRLILDSSDRLFSFDQDGLHMDGAQNIVANPEFSEVAEVARILSLIESKESFVSKFDSVPPENERISVRIGAENQEDLFRGCSVVTARYTIGNVQGALGVVGPTRMQYSRIIPLVDYVGEILTRTFHEKWS